MEMKRQKLKERLQTEQKELMYNIASRLDELKNGKYDKTIRKAVKNTS